MSKQSPLVDKVFKLTPYPSQQKGQAQVRSGIFSMSLSIFLLITVMEGDWFTVVIAVYFLIVALQLILAGSALKRMPDRSRAVRVGPQGLYKMIEGSDVAQLPLQRVKALWKSDAEDALWLSTQKGAQRFAPSDLHNPSEWSTFVTHLERSLSHCLWDVSEDLWRDVQANSHQMKRLNQPSAPLSRLLVTLTALSIPVGAALVTWSGVSLEQLVSGYPEVSFMLLGGSASWLNLGAEWGRVAVGPWMHFDLIKLSLTGYTLWWTARTLGQVVGSRALMNIVLIAHLCSALTHQLAGLTFPLLGAFAPQVALLFAQWRMLSAQPPGLDLAVGAKRNTLLWVTFAHVLIFSVYPEQALKTLSLDLSTGVLLGLIMTRLWSLDTPLWRRSPRGGALLTLSLTLTSALTLAGFVSYGVALRQAPLERLERLTLSAPHDPVWSAQLGLMCAVGRCNQQTRLTLQERLAQDALNSPLTAESHPRTHQTHVSQLQLSLARDLSEGVLSERTLQLVSSRAAISPSASFARSLLTALHSAQPSSERLSLGAPSAPHPTSGQLSLDTFAHYPLEPSRPTLVQIKGTSPIQPELAPLKVTAPHKGGAWRFEWSRDHAPSSSDVQWRAWVLIGYGPGTAEESLALLSLPLNMSPFSFKGSEALASKSPQGAEPPSTAQPWLKVLTVAPQPSAAKSQRALLWRARAPLSP